MFWLVYIAPISFVHVNCCLPTLSVKRIRFLKYSDDAKRKLLYLNILNEF